ncbi:hypothetical protein BKA82DRAFT_30971 [Pisolithus tinctorius]|nr:hypothetical protein BKA82DRAFT_30971 [Pisolithus tinctorius]
MPGTTFKDKNTLLTSVSKGSIGVEILKGLVLVAPMLLSPLPATVAPLWSITKTFTEGSGSKQDVEAPINYIYATLGMDLDYILPFAAVPENGRKIDGLDNKLELAHHIIMLVNLLWILGAIKTKKASGQLVTQPAQVIFPLSPNHGLFGNDDLYSESKISLETLFNHWNSKSWGEYLCLAGAVIGWTCSMGLMDATNIFAREVEAYGVHTFSAKKMAFNILGLMHPLLFSITQVEPIWADLNGRIDHLLDLADITTRIRMDLNKKSELCHAIARDNAPDFKVINGAEGEHALQNINVVPRANFKFDLPTLEPASAFEELSKSRGIIDSEKVIVMTGFAKVSPWHSSWTQWEMEARGEFTIEGCINMARIMGSIKHFDSHLKDGTLHVGWVDAKTGEPVDDNDIRSQYEKEILSHAGVRLIGAYLSLPCDLLLKVASTWHGSWALLSTLTTTSKTVLYMVGWVDAKTGEPVDDKDVRSQYEKEILSHAGVCLIELLEKNTVLEANKTRRSTKDIPTDVIAYDSEIKMLGKKYAVMMEMFLPRTPLTNAMSELSMSPTPIFATAECYANAAVEEHSLVAELDSILPEHLRRLRHTHFFLDVFMQAMQNGHSDILYKLCDNAHEIFGLPKNHFLPVASRLEVPEIVKMLGVNDVGTPNQRFTIWFPFLFKDMKVDVHKPFMNWKPLALILKGALWGKMSLTEGFVRRGGPRTNGQKWKVTAVTPGSIAWAAMVCMFLLSPDKEFPGNGCGQISKIDYYQVFHMYKQVLITKWMGRHIQNIVAEMNHFVFGNPNGATKSKTSVMEDLSVEINAAMAAMDATVLSDDDTDEVAAADSNIHESSSGLSTPDSVSIGDVNVHVIVTSTPAPGMGNTTNSATANSNNVESSTGTTAWNKSSGCHGRGRQAK